MLDPLHPTDAERAANAIVSLRNDERMRHLSANFHDIMSRERFDPNPPSQAELAEAFRFKYGLAHEAD
jgi:tRNA nucleotidyltransferase (CCA-adding enzyme)